MNDKERIIEYFINDDEFPATVTKIEPLSENNGHLYLVTYIDEDGEYETEVGVVDYLVFILPE